MRQEPNDVGMTKIRRMAVAVEADEATDPVLVSLLRAQTAVLEANARTYEIEQAGRDMDVTLRQLGRTIRNHA